MTERVAEAKGSPQEEKTIFGSTKDHKKDIESLHNVLAKFKESKHNFLPDNTISKPVPDFAQSVQNSNTKIKSLEAFLTSRRNSSKEKAANAKKDKEGSAKAKKRLHLKDFSSSYGNINIGLNNYPGFKTALYGKFDSANDSLVDLAPLIKPSMHVLDEPEAVTIESADCGFDLNEDTHAATQDSFCNQELSILMTALKQFVKLKDDRIRQLELENQKLKEIIWPSKSGH